MAFLSRPQAHGRPLARQTTWTALDCSPSLVRGSHPPNGLRQPLALQPTLLVGDDGEVLGNQPSAGIWAHRGLTRQLTQESSVSSFCSASSTVTVRYMGDRLSIQNTQHESSAARGLPRQFNQESSISSETSMTLSHDTVRPSGEIEECKTSHSIFDINLTLAQLSSMEHFPKRIFYQSVVAQPPISMYQTEENRKNNPNFPQGMVFRLQITDIRTYGVPLLECIDQHRNRAYMKDSHKHIPFCWLEKSKRSRSIIIEITWPGYPNMSWKFHQDIKNEVGLQDESTTRRSVAANIACHYHQLISAVEMHESGAMNGGPYDPSLIGQDPRWKLGGNGTALEKMKKMQLVSLEWAYGNVFHPRIAFPVSA